MEVIRLLGAVVVCGFYFFMLFFHYSSTLFLYLSFVFPPKFRRWVLRLDSPFLLSVFSLSTSVLFLYLFLYCHCSLSGYFRISYYLCGVSPNLTSYVLLGTHAITFVRQ